MSNLIPEKRLDKNGKLVTRHVAVRPVSSSVSLPMPTLELSTDIRDRICSKVDRVIEGAPLAVIRDSMSVYWDNTIEAMEQYLDLDPEAHAPIVAECSQRNFDDDKANDFYNYAIYAKDSVGDTLTTSRIVQGVHACYEFRHTDQLSRNIKPEDQLLAKALIQVTSAAYSSLGEEHRACGTDYVHDSIAIVIKSQELLSLVRDHPQHADEISRLIKKYGFEEDSSIRATLENGIHESVKDGWL